MYTHVAKINMTTDTRGVCTGSLPDGRLGSGWWSWKLREVDTTDLVMVAVVVMVMVIVRMVMVMVVVVVRMVVMEMAVVIQL